MNADAGAASAAAGAASAAALVFTTAFAVVATMAAAEAAQAAAPAAAASAFISSWFHPGLSWFQLMGGFTMHLERVEHIDAQRLAAVNINVINWKYTQF